MIPSTARSSEPRRRLVPSYLDASDRPWLSRLLELHASYVGRSRGEWRARSAGSWPFAAPAAKLALALAALDRALKTEVSARVEPKVLRERLFGEAARGEAPDEVWRAEATAQGVSVEVLRRELFADLPDARLIVAPDVAPSVEELTLRANLALVQGHLCRAARVVIALEGSAGNVIRHARARGLICSLSGAGAGEAALVLSGPLTLFRRTIMYGRALGALLPALAWCARFELRADCVIDGERRELYVESGAPILPARPPPAFDSKLEERFAKAFRRHAPDWELVREPGPVRAGHRLALPDFALERRATGERWLLEIVGFWTREYLARKLELYRSAGLPRLVLAIDAERACDDGALPAGARIVRFRGRRLDPAAVLAAIEG